MGQYLFVYGTLMNTFESPMTKLISENSTYWGEGTVRGRLYDLGNYPGLVIGEQTETLVGGQIFGLLDPGKVLDLLDRYEGLDPLRPDRGEYRREKISVLTAEGPFTCWAYLYNGNPKHLKVIPGGNYVDYARNNPRHQQFIKSV